MILIVGAAGSGALEMLGVASTVIDEWTNNGLLNRTRWPAER